MPSSQGKVGGVFSRFSLLPLYKFIKSSREKIPDLEKCRRGKSGLLPHNEIFRLSSSVFQIRRGNGDNLGIISLISP